MNAQHGRYAIPLCLLVLASGSAAHAGISNVSVTLSGPTQGWVLDDLTYTASGSYELDEATQEEVNNGDAWVMAWYSWSHPPAELVSGWMGTRTIRYPWDAGGTDCTVSVTYTVTVHYETGDPVSASDSDSLVVAVSIWKPYSGIECDGIEEPEAGDVYCVGEEVACEVAEPTDLDERAIGSTSTYPADSFGDENAYVWTCTHGSFKDGINKGTQVTWVAPSTGYEAVDITITVNDDAIIPAGERGNRNDPPWTDTVTVKVVGVQTIARGSVEIMSGAVDEANHKTTITATIFPVVEGISISFEVVDPSPALTAASISPGGGTTDVNGQAEVELTSSNTPEEGHWVTVKAKCTNGSGVDQKQTTVELLVPSNEFYEPE